MAMRGRVPAFDRILPAAPHAELHQRVIAAPIDDVWPHCLEVTAREIRLLGPLMALRRLPALLAERRMPSAAAPRPLLDVFTAGGFVVLRRDSQPLNGRASIVLGAAGRFWSLRDNAPVNFDDPAEFLGFARPGFAKAVSRLEAIDLGDGMTRIETETLATCTDPASAEKFARYWTVIRLPSGAIRRSWLAAIDRRVKATSI